MGTGPADSLFAVTITRRPGKDSASAGGGADAVGWASGRFGLCSCPPELGAVGPNALQNDCDLARNGDTRLLASDAFPKPHSPGFHGREALHLGPQHVRRFIKTGTRERISALWYPPLPIGFSGLVSCWVQSEVWADIAGVSEAPGIVDRGQEGGPPAAPYPRPYYRKPLRERLGLADQDLGVAWPDNQAKRLQQTSPLRV